ncbi:MAG: PilZ domain-containing protein [Candidatus Omnitrophica bacterium]|nr:PilZ domain-containing protein [Candidatus Omnitrophota bacterium]
MEHRARARLEVALKVKWKFLEGDAKDLSLIRDVSEEGLQIEVEKEILPGTRLGLSIQLPGDESMIEAEAVVCWTRKAHETWRTDYDAGLRVTRLNESDRERLFHYLKLRMTGQV